MALVKSASLRWGVIFLCMILGTWLGLFLQRFSATSLLFSNIVDFTVDVREIDLLMLRLGFLFALKLNLGTLIGAISGIVGLGWEFRVEPSLITETKPEGETPAHLVKRLAFEKASEVAGRFPGNWVVGADTVVAIDGMILGKPKDEAEAKSMLRRLAGATHSVFTGVALIAPDGRSLAETDETKVTFRPLSDEEISAYVACGESMDKAGAYAIQGRGISTSSAFRCSC